MTHFSHIPMVRIIIPVLAGVMLYIHLEIYIPVRVYWAAAGVFALSALMIERWAQQNFRYRFAFGFNAMLFLFVSAYFLAQGRNQQNDSRHFSNFTTEASMVRIKLTEPVSEKTNTWQITGSVTHVLTDSAITPTTGKLILYLEKDSLAAGLAYGDVLFLSGQVNEVQPPRNPHAFDFRKFLARQNIFHQAYRSSGQWYFSGQNEGSYFVKKAHQMRTRALHILEENNIREREFSVASALLLGYRDYLDEDLRREFAGAGAMHILCVSGLHVGIIFLALNFMLAFMKRLPYGRLLKTLSIIALIWFYAAITGFSPSVMRASTMFTFVALGQNFRRSTNIYNTLAASALILILLNPLIISRIGFQLSYIAVISIVWLQPVFYKWMYFKNPILDKAWGIITVSLAAQLGTGPLAVYYFNQFPNFFLLTNLVVIPLTGLIIKSGILLFLLSPIGFLSQLAGKALSLLVLALHSSVRFVEGLPASVSNNISITMSETLLIFTIIILTALFFISQKRTAAMAGMAGLLLLCSSFTYRLIEKQNRQKLVVYHLTNGLAMDIYTGNNCYMWACENAIQNERNLLFATSENRQRMGTAAKGAILLNDSANYFADGTIYRKDAFIHAGNKTFKVLDKHQDLSTEVTFTGQIDVLIITGNPAFSMERIFASLPAHHIVFDATNHIFRTRNWMEECNALGLNCWSVREQGAFTLALQQDAEP